MTHGVLIEPMPEIHLIQEPLLSFASGSRHVNPKVGIAPLGPHSVSEARHPTRVTAGFIGTPKQSAIVRQWLEAASRGVDGAHYTLFPAFAVGRASGALGSTRSCAQCSAIEPGGGRRSRSS
jgi:hypothetical protein